jgi:tetratricopeptide (TPR) repeat protein
MNKRKLIKCFIISTISITGLVACGSSADSARGYIESGKTLLADGKPEKARLEFKNAIQVDPKIAESYYQLALLDEKVKNWKLMFANLSKVEKLDANHHDAMIKLGRLNLLLGELELALERANKVIKQDDKKTMAWLLRSGVALKQNNYESAIKDVNQALQLEVNNIEALSLKAFVLNKQDKATEALALLSTALTNNPDALPLTMIKISIFEQQKKYSEMESIYKGLQQKHAAATWVHVSLAKLYNAQNRYEDAKEVLQQFVVAQPDMKEAKMLLVSLVQTKEPELAITLLDSYIKLQPEASDLRFSKAKLLLTSKQVDAALEELQQIASLPNGGENARKAKIMLASFDLQQGEKDAANEKIQDILQKAPENEAALLLKARIDIANNNIDTAVTNLRVVLRNNPESDQALVLLAQAYMRSGSTELAEDNFRQALEVNPGNIVDAKILMLGLTFKENCPDLRNTRVVEMIEELTNTYNAKVDVFDPWVDKKEAQAVYNLNLIDQPAAGQYDAMIVAVSHEQFKELGIGGVKALGKEKHVLYDIKYLFPSDGVDVRL